MSFEAFFDAERDHHRLKQLVAERYLEETQDGWIYRRAYSYRGARQAEDEERAGRRLLIQAFSRPEWLRRRLFLAQQAAGVVPHGLPSSEVKRARNLAKSIADADPGFQPLRVKIHSSPEHDKDRVAVERYLKERAPSETVRTMLLELATLLQQESATRLLAKRLPAASKGASESLKPAAEAFEAALRKKDAAATYAAGARLSAALAREVFRSSDGARNLELLDLNALVLDAGFQQVEAGGERSRRELLELLRNDFLYAFGAGLLSERQLGALEQRLDELLRVSGPSAQEYFEAIRYLSRAAEWSRATASREFLPVEQLYESFEPAAAGLLDHLLRSSPALPLASRSQALADDAARLAGIRHQIFDSSSAAGVFGLNPGRARARLEIFDQPGQPVHSDRIYVIPETAADLKPMAGMLTLDSGNALSHAQLLAANLGLPNAVVPSSLLPALRRRAGQEVIFEVGRRGEVTLRTPAEGEIEVASDGLKRLTLDVGQLRLDVRGALPLRGSPSSSRRRVRSQGRQSGPAGATVSGRVSPGLVIPFGVYVQHIQRPMEGDSAPLAVRIAEAFDEAERMRASARPSRTFAPTSTRGWSALGPG